MSCDMVYKDNDTSLASEHRDWDGSCNIYIELLQQEVKKQPLVTLVVSE